MKEFKTFLSKYEEWTPLYWKGATRGYEELYKEIQNNTAPDNLATTLQIDLPEDAREAFIGWKNFTMEKEALKNFSPTFDLLKEFLTRIPQFPKELLDQCPESRATPTTSKPYSFIIVQARRPKCPKKRSPPSSRSNSSTTRSPWKAWQNPLEGSASLKIIS